MKIGVFDSGIGGLSVLYEGLMELPDETFLFYADSSHVPYGEKSRDEVIRYVENAVRFLIEEKVDAVVLACNTATSVAGKLLRSKYELPIIGMEPAAKKALDSFSEKRVLVVATPITVKGDKMQDLIGKIDTHHLVDLQPLPKLVRFAENGVFESEEVFEYLRSELSEYDWEAYSSLVLGCTHFNYFKDAFRQIIPETVHFIDGNEGTIHQLSRMLSLNYKIDEQEMKTQSKRLQDHLEERVEFYKSGIKVTDPMELNKIHNLLERLEFMYQMN